MIWGQGKVSQDAQQRKDSTICNAMYNAICSQKTELCFADAAICYSAHVATLDFVQLHSRLMLIMPGSLHWTIRLTAFSWTDGAKHHNNVFVVSCRDLRLRKIISRERIVKKREMLIVDQFQGQGHLQKKSRKPAQNRTENNKDITVARQFHAIWVRRKGIFWLHTIIYMPTTYINDNASVNIFG